ncbi:MAG: hypothetical protein HHJ12_17625 [Glaciimonas sp.]|nr:hypothetical protein [Glaciimonas sp.]
MNRKTFLTFASIIALGVGAFALLQPAVLLESKGVALNAAADVWMRELGIALISIGVMLLVVRGHPDSPTLRAFLIGNAILQLGLLPIEIVAFVNGVITKVSGIVPNSVLHLLLACGFAYFAISMKTPTQT